MLKESRDVSLLMCLLLNIISLVARESGTDGRDAETELSPCTASSAPLHSPKVSCNDFFLF